jgi:membrane fusion protein, multidrug efflux system
MAGIFNACKNDQVVQEETDPASVRSELQATEVQTTAAEVKKFEYLVQGNGKIEAVEENWLIWEGNGQLTQLLVRNGDVVKPGQLLAKLNTDKLQLNYEKTLVQYKERNLEYENQLLGFKNASKAVHENLRFSSGLATAELNLKEAELALKQAELRAGINGVVSDLQMKQGALVNPGDKLCVIHNPNKLMVQMPVIESEVGALHTGIVADVNIMADAGKVVRGTLTEINPRVDDKSGMLNLRIMLNQTQGLLPGMNVRVTLRIPYDEHIIIPKEAVVLRSGRQVVFTLEGNLAKWNYVQTGRENGREIEILDGLKPGAQVIITNNLQLAHDAQVKAIAEIVAD